MPASVREQGGRVAGGCRPGLSSVRVASLAMLILATDPALFARAQTTGSNAVIIPMRITVPATIAAEKSGPTPLPIEVSPIETLPPNAFVRIKGLPQGAALTEGYAVAPGTWAVALKSLPALQANFPPMPSGRNDVALQLLSGDGALLAETQFALVFGAATPVPPAAKAPPPAEASALPPRDPTPPPPALSAEEQQKAERFVAQGDRFLDSGNIAVARQYYQRAADAGLAAGALKLGATYDPAELDRIAVQGVVAQPAEAKRWYERALALGAREAKERLARLANTN